ncbi:MAG: extracellular solute-binding protein [Cellulosilyticaceae bacterium]
MRGIKKWSLFLMAQVLVVSSLAGCGGKTPNSSGGTASGSKDNGKPMEISIAHWDVEKALGGGANDKILKTIEDKFNVKFVPMNITWDDYVQKIQLWAASGSLPDIFSIDAIGTAYYHDWIDQGIVKGLPEDLSAYPDLKEYLAADDIEALKVNNQLYCVPRKTYPDNYWNILDRTVMYRWDLAQKAGVTKEPETWEEFSDMVQKIIAADPEGKNIGGMTATATSLLDGLLFTYSLPAAMSDGSGSDYKWVEKDGQYIPAYFAGDGLANFQLARDLYSKGVIEKDIALTKLDQAQDKFLQGQSVAILRGGGPETLYDYAGKHWQEIYPGQNILDDVKMLKLFPGKDGKKYFSVFRTSWSESYISSNVDDTKMAKILEIYNYFVSEEGQKLINYGFEGEDYDVVDGKMVMKDLVAFDSKYTFTKGLNNLVQWNPAVWNEAYPTSTPEGYREMSMAKYKEAKEEGTMPEFDMRYTYLSTPLKDQFVIKPADDLLTIMMGTESVDKMYDKLLKDYETKGLSAMIKEVNDKAKELGWQK